MAESSKVSRRNALKAGAAAGVGAAAFAGPQIGALGSAPAYAAVCSRGLTCVDVGRESVNLGSNCGPAAQLNAVINASGNGITIDSGGAKPCFDGSFPINVSSSFAQCQVSIRIFIQGNGGGSGNPICNRTVTGPVGPGTGSLAMPLILDAELNGICTGSLFAEFSVCCSDEASCF